MRAWKSNVVYLAELSLVLNHKIWQWFDKDKKKAKLYDYLWSQVHDYAYSGALSEEDLHYYFQTTD